uniref:Uncharacterized protein n=1 Tax=Heterorhabditis bacteriophora TaxID=37862 RepID=A0A1I7WDE6_HETBA
MDKSSLSIGLASNAVYPLVRNTANHPPDLPPRGVQKLRMTPIFQRPSRAIGKTPIVVLKRVSRLARHCKPVDDNYIMGETALLWRS